jgi:hypothetical protein
MRASQTARKFRNAAPFAAQQRYSLVGTVNSMAVAWGFMYSLFCAFPEKIRCKHVINNLTVLCLEASQVHLQTNEAR